MERYSATTGKLATLNSNMTAKLRLPGSPSSVAKLLMQVRNSWMARGFANLYAMDNHIVSYLQLG